MRLNKVIEGRITIAVEFSFATRVSACMRIFSIVARSVAPRIFNAAIWAIKRVTRRRWYQAYNNVYTVGMPPTMDKTTSRWSITIVEPWPQWDIVTLVIGDGTRMGRIVVVLAELGFRKISVSRTPDWSSCTCKGKTLYL
jgi:hypothetical protein